MALESAVVPVIFAGGLSQKTDAKLVAPGKFLVLQNAVRKKQNLWEKRYGFTSLTTTYNSGQSSTGTITSGVHLAALRDQLCLLDGQNLYGYNVNAARWGQPTACPVVGFNTYPVASRGNTYNGDIAYTNGFYGLTWQEVVGGSPIVQQSIVDAATGRHISLPGLFGASNVATPHKVCAVGNYLLFFTVNFSHQMSIYVWNTVNHTGTLYSTVRSDAAIALYTFDVENFDGTACVFVYNNTSNGLTVAYFNASTGAIGSGSNGYAAPVTINSATTLGTQGLAICTGVGGRPFIAYYDSATSTNVTVTGFTTNLATTASTTFSYSNVKALALCELSTNSSNSIQVLMEVMPAALGSMTSDVRIQEKINIALVTWTGSGALGTGFNSQWLCTMGMASKPAFANGFMWLMTAFDTTLQPTYYLYRFPVTNGSISGNAVCTGRFLASEGGGLTRGASFPPALNFCGLPRLTLGAGGAYSTLLYKRLQATIDSSDNLTNATYGMLRYDLTFSGFSPQGSELGNSLVIAGGGLTQQFDGLGTAELGFSSFPETLSATAVGGGSLSGGTYSYRVTYEYVDANGLVHQSAPSPAKSASAAAGQALQISIPPLYISSKPNEAGGANVVTAVVWVAPVGTATIFYRAASTAAFSFMSVAYSAVVATVSSDPSTTAQILYTTGGINEYIAPVAARCAHVYKNRVWLGGLEGDEIQFSNEFEDGAGISFSDTYIIPIESAGGRVYALGTLDDKLIILKKDRLYYLAGEGPNTAGQQWDYPEPIRIAADVGTTIPQSVVELPTGLLFKSSKGWFLLDRALRTQYVGADVDSYNGNNVTSATVIVDQNEVRLTHSDADTLVYNYLYDTWSVFTNYQAVGSTLANGGTFYHLKSSGVVNGEVAGQYNDNGTVIDMALETSWLSMSRLQGFQRIYDIEILGDWFTDFHCKVSLAYDFHSAYNQVITFTTTGQFTDVFQLRIQPALQKCTALKLKIETIDDIVNGGGACFKPSAITLEVGRKRGVYKLPANTTA